MPRIVFPLQGAAILGTAQRHIRADYMAASRWRNARPAGMRMERPDGGAIPGVGYDVPAIFRQAS